MKIRIMHVHLLISSKLHRGVSSQANAQPQLHAVGSLLGVEDGSQQREDGNVGRGDLHGGQVGHVVVEGPLRLANKRRRAQMWT